MHLLLCSHVSPPKVPPLWGGQSWQQVLRPAPSQMRVLPLRLATGPPLWGGQPRRVVLRRMQRQVRVLSLPPFFLVPYSPQNGGECCHTKAPPTFGGAQLRGGWPPPVGGPTSLPSCHWPPHSVGGPRRLVLRRAPRQMRVLSLPPFFLVPHPPKTGGVLPHKGPPHLWGGASCVEGGPPLWGGQLPFPLATGPPIVWGGHGAWCYGKRRGKCECFPSHPFFWCLIPPKTGGSVATQRPPPPLGGAQLRGGWPPPCGGPTSLPSCHWPPPSVGGQPRRLVLRRAPRQMRVLSLPLATGPPLWGGQSRHVVLRQNAEASASAFLPYPPQNGGECCQRPPHLWGGAQLRGGSSVECQKLARPKGGTPSKKKGQGREGNNGTWHFPLHYP